MHEDRLWALGDERRIAFAVNEKGERRYAESDVRAWLRRRDEPVAKATRPRRKQPSIIAPKGVGFMAERAKRR